MYLLLVFIGCIARYLFYQLYLSFQSIYPIIADIIIFCLLALSQPVIFVFSALDCQNDFVAMLDATGTA